MGVEEESITVKHDYALQDAAPIHIEAVQSNAEVPIEDQDFKWSFDVMINVITLTFSFLGATWQNTALPVSLPFINAAFPLDSAKTPWVASTPSLAVCVLSLFVGELSDIFGRRWFLITANVLEVIGTIIASRGQTVNTIIGGQVITGIGISLAYIASPALAEIVPKRHRSTITGVTAGLVAVCLGGLGVATGAFTKYNVGGHNNGWRLAAYLGAAVAFIAALLTFFFYRPSPRPNPGDLTVMERLKKIDWLGVVIGCAGLTLFLVGLQFGGNAYPWKSARVLSCIVVGGVLLVVFAVWEAKFVGFGLFPRQCFQNRNFAIILGAQFVEGMGVYTGSAFLTQIQFLIYTSDPVMAQVRCLPSNSPAIIGAAIAAYIIYKTREAKWVAIGALGLATLAAGLFSLNRPDSNYIVFFIPALLMGFAVTSMGVCVQVIATVCTPNQLIATASSLCNSMRGLGGAVGVVIFSQVLASKMKIYLPATIAQKTVEAGLPVTSVEPLLIAYNSGDVAALSKVPGVTPAVLGALNVGSKLGYSKSFTYMWYAMIPFCGSAALVALFLKPTKPYTTMEVSSKVQERFSHKENGSENPEKM